MVGLDHLSGSPRMDAECHLRMALCSKCCEMELTIGLSWFLDERFVFTGDIDYINGPGVLIA